MSKKWIALIAGWIVISIIGWVVIFSLGVDSTKQVASGEDNAAYVSLMTTMMEGTNERIVDVDEALETRNRSLIYEMAKLGFEHENNAFRRLTELEVDKNIPMEFSATNDYFMESMAIRMKAFRSLMRAMDSGSLQDQSEFTDYSEDADMWRDRGFAAMENNN